jgi:hypothetical protein
MCRPVEPGCAANDEASAVAFLEQQQWGDSPACPRCGDAAVLLPLRFVLVMSLMENRVEPLDWRSRLVRVGCDISREGRLAQQ